jgi:hypothetical protein
VCSAWATGHPLSSNEKALLARVNCLELLLS